MFYLGALCRSLAFYNSNRPISRPPSYRSVVDQTRNQANNNGSNSNRTDDLTNNGQINQDKLSASQLKKISSQENHNIKDNVHRVTIHQTNTSSQVCTNGVNIVAISSSLPMISNEFNQTNSDNRSNENEVQILAHL